MPQTLFGAINKVTYWSVLIVKQAVEAAFHPAICSLCRHCEVLMAAEEADILVVGGGPVGLTMAAELSYRGIKNILVEKKTTTSVIAKAILITARSMEQYRRLGLQASIEEVSYPRDQKICFTIATSGTGPVISEETLSSWGELADEVPGAEFIAYQAGASISVPVFCPQSIIEPILKSHLDTCSNTKMFWGWDVSSMIQDENGVTIKAVQTPTSGDPQEKIFRAKYLVGCDGGSSWVRKQLGIHTFGKFVITRAISITFRSPELYARMKQQHRIGMNMVLNKNISAFLVTLSTKGEFAIHATFDSKTSDEEIDRQVQNASQLVVHAMGESIPHTVAAVSAYNKHALISTKYRNGRCFLAGDSAHQWLPTAGLGMNAGLADTVDLAWKLEAVLKRYGGTHLLDSFEMERRPIADSTRRFTLSFGTPITSGFIRRIRLFVVSNPVTRFILGCILEGAFRVQFITSNDFVLGFQYSNSTIVVHEYDSSGNIKLTPSSVTEFVTSSLPGCRAPHVVLPDCATILDLFGKQFVLLIIGGQETDCEALKAEMQNREVPFEVHSLPKLPKLTALYNRKYFLVRPDGVVAWRSDSQPNSAEARNIVSIIVGDASPKRVPARIQKSPFPFGRPTALFDALVSFSATLLLQGYTNLSFSSTIGIGMGFFWIRRAISTFPKTPFVQSISGHQAIVMNQFGSAGKVLKLDPRFVGEFGPKDVVIRVHAASINPIDLRIREGYGAPMLRTIARLTRGKFFPLILGRDCSGEVVAVGDEVKKFMPGDMVYAAVSMERQGTHSQYVAVSEDHVGFKPAHVDHKEAASFPWVAVTSWTALVQHAGLNEHNTRGKRVLIHAGTGGVGSFAVQLMKAWGAEVATTCSTNNVTLAHHLGADKVIDYTAGDFTTVLKNYDVVFDTIGRTYESKSLSVLKWFGGATYVSVITPKILLISKFGNFFGNLLFSWLYRLKVLVNRLLYGRAFYYAIAQPNGEGLEVVSRMIDRGAIRPQIDTVYTMDEIVDAHKHVEGGHTRGKVIVTMV